MRKGQPLYSGQDPVCPLLRGFTVFIPIVGPVYTMSSLYNYVGQNCIHKAFTIPSCTVTVLRLYSSEYRAKCHHTGHTL